MLFYITHTDEQGERWALTGAWEAANEQDAVAQMLIDCGDEDDGCWSAHEMPDLAPTFVEFALDEALDAPHPSLKGFEPMLRDMVEAGEEPSQDQVAWVGVDTPLDAKGYVMGPDATLRIAFFPLAHRACVINNAGTNWTDADSVEDAFLRYQTDDLRP